MTDPTDIPDIPTHAPDGRKLSRAERSALRKEAHAAALAATNDASRKRPKSKGKGTPASPPPDAGHAPSHAHAGAHEPAPARDDQKPEEDQEEPGRSLVHIRLPAVPPPPAKLVHFPTQATRNVVAGMRANGFTTMACARYLKIDEETLLEHYADEVDHGFEQIAAQIAGAVVTGALLGDQKDQHFWLKNRVGWGRPDVVARDGRVTEYVAPVASKALNGAAPGNMPPPGDDGTVELSMVIGIAGDSLGKDDVDDDDDEG